MKRNLLIVFLILVSTLLGCTRPPLAPPQEEELTESAVVDTGMLQEGNELPKTQLQPKQSPELEDNKISTALGSYDPGYLNTQVVYPIGFKWMRISFNIDPLNWQYTEIQSGEYSIAPDIDNLITEYSENGNSNPGQGKGKGKGKK